MIERLQISFKREFNLDTKQILFDKNKLIELLENGNYKKMQYEKEHTAIVSLAKLQIFAKEYFKNIDSITYSEIVNQYFVVFLAKIKKQNILTSEKIFVNSEYVKQTLGNRDIEFLKKIYSSLQHINSLFTNEFPSIDSIQKYPKITQNIMQTLQRQNSHGLVEEHFSTMMKHIYYKIFGLDLIIAEIENTASIPRKLQLGRAIQSIDSLNAGMVFSPTKLTNEQLQYISNNIRQIKKQSFISTNFLPGSDEVVYLHTINAFNTNNFIDSQMRKILDTNYRIENKSFSLNRNTYGRVKKDIAIMNKTNNAYPRKTNEDLLMPMTPSELDSKFRESLIIPKYKLTDRYGKKTIERVYIASNTGLASLDKLGKDIRSMLVHNGFPIEIPLEADIVPYIVKNITILKNIITNYDLLKSATGVKEFFEQMNPNFIKMYQSKFPDLSNYELAVEMNKFLQHIQQRYEEAVIQQALNDFSNIDQFVNFAINGKHENAILNQIESIEKFMQIRGKAINRITYMKFENYERPIPVIFSAIDINRPKIVNRLTNNKGKVIFYDTLVFGLHYKPDNKLLNETQILQLGGIIIKNERDYADFLVDRIKYFNKLPEYNYELLSVMKTQLDTITRNIKSDNTTNLTELKKYWDKLLVFGEFGTALRNKINCALFCNHTSGLFSNFVPNKSGRLIFKPNSQYLELTDNCSKFVQFLNFYNYYYAPQGYIGINHFINSKAHLSIQEENTMKYIEPSEIKKEAEQRIYDFIRNVFSQNSNFNNRIFLPEISFDNQKIRRIKFTDKKGNIINITQRFYHKPNNKRLENILGFVTKKSPVNPQASVEGTFNNLLNEIADHVKYPYLSKKLKQATKICEYNDILNTFYERRYFGYAEKDAKEINSVCKQELNDLIVELSNSKVLRSYGFKRKNVDDMALSTGGRYEYSDETLQHLTFKSPFRSYNANKDLLKINKNGNTRYLTLNKNSFTKHVDELSKTQNAALNLIINRYNHIDTKSIEKITKEYGIINQYDGFKVWQQYIFDMYQVQGVNLLQKNASLKKLQKIRLEYKYDYTNVIPSINYLLLGKNDTEKISFNAYDFNMGIITKQNSIVPIQLDYYGEIFGQLDYLIIMKNSLTVNENDTQFIKQLWKNNRIRDLNSLTYKQIFVNIADGIIKNDKGRFFVSNPVFVPSEQFLTILSQNYLPPSVGRVFGKKKKFQEYMKRTTNGKYVKNTNEEQVMNLLGYGLVPVFTKNSKWTELINEGIEFITRIIKNNQKIDIVAFRLYMKNLSNTVENHK